MVMLGYLLRIPCVAHIAFVIIVGCFADSWNGFFLYPGRDIKSEVLVHSELNSQVRPTQRTGPFLTGLFERATIHLERKKAMKKSKFTEQQITWALKQADMGTPILEVCRKLGIAKATFFNWKRKYGGVGTLETRRLRDLETENQKLKQILANLSLDKIMLQEALSKKL
jgi:putative transposase